MNIHKNARLTYLRRLEMVQDITDRGLPASEAAVAYGVSAVTARKWHVALLASLVHDATDRAYGLIKVIGMDAATWDAGCIALARACRGDELKRPHRAQHCRTVARQVMVAAGDLFEATLAQQVAERAGVPPEQQAYDAATLKAAQSALLAQAHGDGLDCASMATNSEFSAQRAARGELALALALSLLPPADARARQPASAALRPGAAASAR